MLNLKKLLTKLVNQSYMTVAQVTSSSFTIPANTAANTIINVTRSGYKPLGTVGIAKTGAGSGDALITSFLFDGTNVNIYFRNIASTERTITAVVNVLYQKVGGVIPELIHRFKAAFASLRKGVIAC